VGNVSTNVFLCAPLRIKKALGIFRELIPIRTRTTRVASGTRLSGPKCTFHGIGLNTKPCSLKKILKRKDKHKFTCLSIILSYNFCFENFLSSVGFDDSSVHATGSTTLFQPRKNIIMLFICYSLTLYSSHEYGTTQRRNPDEITCHLWSCVVEIWQRLQLLVFFSDDLVI